MKLKVFGGLTRTAEGKYVRTIFATKSIKEAANLVGLSVFSFIKYWSMTGNAIECKIALSKPGAIFKASTTDGFDFTEQPSCKRL
jgi:hypothetical protein